MSQLREIIYTNYERDFIADIISIKGLHDSIIKLTIIKSSFL